MDNPLTLRQLLLLIEEYCDKYEHFDQSLSGFAAWLRERDTSG